MTARANCMRNHTLQIEEWLAANLPPSGKVGIDPLVHTVDTVRKLNKKMQVRKPDTRE